MPSSFAAAATSRRPTAERSEKSHDSRGNAVVNKSADTETTGKPLKGVDDALSFANTPLTVAPSLKGFTNLHRLDLSNTGLKSIGFVRAVKSTLTWLNVSGNSGLNSKGSWDGIEEMSKLFVLNASNCALTAVPSVIESLRSLKALVLSNNQLSSLSYITSLPDLNTLVISNNVLTSLPASLTTLSSLKKISAAHNKLTSDSLPDLSVLSQLREVKLNDNRELTSLPAHFSTWGKGSLGHLAAEMKGGKRRATGLEILDLGNCGFEDWIELQSVVAQPGITNLVLKGTKVALEAQEEGFDVYKRKLLILLPALRILDGQRFDAKFFDLREKRLARPESELVLPPPVIASTSIISTTSKKVAQRSAAEETRAILEAKLVEETRLVKELKKKVYEDEVAKLEEAKNVKKSKKRVASAEIEIEETGPEKKKSKKVKVAAVVSEEPGDDFKIEVVKEKKPKRKIIGEDGVEVPKKKKKNRHEPRASAATPTSTAAPVAAVDVTVVPSVPTTVKDASVIPGSTLTRKEKKSAKIKANALAAATPGGAAKDKQKIVQRTKKHKDGVLSALKGTDAEQAAELAERSKAKEAKEASKVAVALTAEPAQVDKVKTSVVGVVVVKKDKKEKMSGGEKLDISSLLGVKPVSAAMSWN